MLAAIPVVELPVNGSNIQAFSFVEAKIILAKSGSGFCVGCLPQDFSHSHLLTETNLPD